MSVRKHYQTIRKWRSLTAFFFNNGKSVFWKNHTNCFILHYTWGLMCIQPKELIHLPKSHLISLDVLNSPSLREMWVPHPPFIIANAIVPNHLASCWVLLWLVQSDQCSFHYQACCLALLEDGNCSPQSWRVFQEISLHYWIGFKYKLMVGI